MVYESLQPGEAAVYWFLVIFCMFYMLAAVFVLVALCAGLFKLCLQFERRNRQKIIRQQQLMEFHRQQEPIQDALV
jgi:Flp pilus assembly protein TadB